MWVKEAGEASKRMIMRQLCLLPTAVPAPNMPASSAPGRSVLHVAPY